MTITTSTEGTTGSVGAAGATPVDPGWSSTFRAEWTKLWTARSPRRNLLLGIVLGVAFSSLVAVGTGATFDEWSTADQANFDPILFPMTGSIFVAIFFAAVGVNVVASEYSSEMIRLTLTATPRRHRVLYAKAATVAIATGIAAAVAIVGMMAAGQLIASAYDLPTVSAGDRDLWRVVLAMTVLGPLFPVIAVAIAFLARSTAAALSSVLALIFVPTMFGQLLPTWWQENVLSLLPGPASDSIAIGHLDDSAMYSHPAAAGIVVVVWAAALIGLAQLRLARRDA